MPVPSDFVVPSTAAILGSCEGATTSWPFTHTLPPHPYPTPSTPPGTGENAIRHLFSRGTHREFGLAAILCMLIFYFLGAAWTGKLQEVLNCWCRECWLRRPSCHPACHGLSP